MGIFHRGLPRAFDFGIVVRKMIFILRQTKNQSYKNFVNNQNPLLSVYSSIIRFHKNICRIFHKIYSNIFSFSYCSNKDFHKIEKISQQSRDNYTSKEKKPGVCNISIDVLSHYRPLSFFISLLTSDAIFVLRKKWWNKEWKCFRSWILNIRYAKLYGMYNIIF